jgi:hypothetical protein
MKHFKTAWYFLSLGVSVIFKNIPFVNAIKNSNYLIKLLSLIRLIRDNKYFKIFKFLSKLVAIINLVMGVGVVIAFNDFSIVEPLKYFYNKIFEGFGNSFKSIIKVIIKKLTRFIDEPEIPSPQNIDSKTESIPSIKRAEYKTPLALATRPRSTDTGDKSFYINPYFIPLFIAVTGVTIYYNYEYITQFLVATGVSTTFHTVVEYFLGSSDGDTPPTAPAAPIKPTPPTIPSDTSAPRLPSEAQLGSSSSSSSTSAGSRLMFTPSSPRYRSGVVENPWGFGAEFKGYFNKPESSGIFSTPTSPVESEYDSDSTIGKGVRKVIRVRKL